MTTSDIHNDDEHGSRLWTIVRKGWSWVLLVAVLGYLVYSINPPINLTERADLAPDFAMRTLDGERFQLSDHRGEVVVLTFWATWCPACRTELPFKQSLHERFEDRPVQFVGVSLDEGGLNTVREFAADRTLTFPQVADRSGLLHEFGGAGGIPATFLIDRDGYIRFQHEGFLATPTLRSAIERLLAE